MSGALVPLELQHLLPLLSKRALSSHKGLFGHVLVIGGDIGMWGAAKLAALAALRVGAGKVSVATRAEHAALLSDQEPALMSHPIENAEALQPLLQQATVVLMGPGLGQKAWGRSMFQAVFQSAFQGEKRSPSESLPYVLDADALNLLAEQGGHFNQWILTPHPGEAARLLQQSTTDIQADRKLAHDRLLERCGGVIVLKGAGTLVTQADGSIGICTAGNPGMASAGMGDVLAGVIAGLCAQKLNLYNAASLGVCLHAAAGDRAAAKGGERGLIATDLLTEVRHGVNEHDVQP